MNSNNQWKSQGAKANMNGKIFETMCIPIFEAHNFIVLNHSEYLRLQPKPARCVIKNAPFHSIYNHIGKTEFLIICDDRRIRVEDKYQQSAGSVDEKFVYMYLNSVYAYEENEIILIIDGGGYKPGARQWVVDAVNNNFLDYKKRGKEIHVFTIIEFLKWFNSNF